jgi:Asp-tRNA(Asn)/Glu-tRNA(Gln) amidotransferase A subunit family amidase
MDDESDALHARIIAERRSGGAAERGAQPAESSSIWNVTGQPAISLPLHATAEGIPVGVQLVAPPGREDLLIALGAQLGLSSDGKLIANPFLGASNWTARRVGR